MTVLIGKKAFAGQAEEKHMNQKKIKAFIHHFNTAIRRLAIGLLFVILAPAALAPLTAYRSYSMQIINLIGIGWMGLCALLAVLHLFFGILGLFSFRKATKSELVLSQEAGAWLLDWKPRCIKHCILTVILGAFLLLPGMLCQITGSNFYRAQNPYVMASYAGAFLFFGGAVSFVFGAVLKLILLRRIRFVTADGIAEEALPKRRH